MSMWFFYALGAGLCNALTDAFSKKLVQSVNEYVVIFTLRLGSLIIFLPVLLWNIPEHISQNFWYILSIVIVLDTAASILVIKALKQTDASLVLPLVGLTPACIVLFSFIINHELPQGLSWLGLACNIVGIYLLQLHYSNRGWLAPFIQLGRNQGTRFALVVVLLWGISSAFDKVAVQASNPFFYTGIVSVGYTLALLPFVLYRNRLKNNYKALRFLPVIGCVQGTGLLLQMLALPLMLVSYVIAVTRSSAVFGVIFGKLFFHEQHIQQRLVGSLFIILGIILLVL